MRSAGEGCPKQYCSPLAPLVVSVRSSTATYHRPLLVDSPLPLRQSPLPLLAQKQSPTLTPTRAPSVGISQPIYKENYRYKSGIFVLVKPL